MDKAMKIAVWSKAVCNLQRVWANMKRPLIIILLLCYRSAVSGEIVSTSALSLPTSRLGADVRTLIAYIRDFRHCIILIQIYVGVLWSVNNSTVGKSPGRDVSELDRQTDHLDRQTLPEKEN